MGSIISRYFGDLYEYRILCKEYSEKEHKVYSSHYYWLLEFSQKKTSLPYLSWKNLNKDKWFVQND